MGKRCWMSAARCGSIPIHGLRCWSKRVYLPKISHKSKPSARPGPRPSMLRANETRLEARKLKPESRRTAMDDRRYGQRGYRDHEKGRQGKPQEPARSDAPAMLPTQTVSRCVNCGTTLPPMTDPNGQCPKCQSELHSCRQCAYFDPGAHFECTQPVPERIA